MGISNSLGASRLPEMMIQSRLSNRRGNEKLQARVRELGERIAANAAARAEVTVESLLDELEQARKSILWRSKIGHVAVYEQLAGVESTLGPWAEPAACSEG